MLFVVCVNTHLPIPHRGDELLLTEMIFNGAFNDLTIEQCVSLLSCFVFQEKVINMLCVYVPTYIHTVANSFTIAFMGT